MSFYLLGLYALHAVPVVGVFCIGLLLVRDYRETRHIRRIQKRQLKQEVKRNIDEWQQANKLLLWVSQNQK